MCGLMGSLLMDSLGRFRIPGLGVFDWTDLLLDGPTLNGYS